MASISITEKRDWLAKWKTAYESVVTGKSYTINTGGTSRSLTRQDADTILKHIEYWQREVDRAESGQRGLNIRFGVPRI